MDALINKHHNPMGGKISKNDVNILAKTIYGAKDVAYKEKVLLKLLELQFEVEMVDAEALSQMNHNRIKTYNKILNDQLRTIRQEVRSIQMSFRMELDLPPKKILRPSSILGHVSN